MKKFLVLVLAFLCILGLAACGKGLTATDANNATASVVDSTNNPQNEAVRISIDDFDIVVDVVQEKPVFYVTNNSEYIITGPKLKLVNMDTDEIITAYEWESTIEPGETSTVKKFFNKNSEDATLEEYEASIFLTFELNYHSADDSVDAWFEYNYLTKTARGFDY